jgi:hypothetical protein
LPCSTSRLIEPSRSSAGRSRPSNAWHAKGTSRGLRASGRAWLDRVKSEVDLWTELAAKLSSTRSHPGRLGTYQECVTQRMQMAAEDGRRMSDECQRFLQNLPACCPTGGRPTGPERVLDLAEHPVHCIRAKRADDTSKVCSRRMNEQVAHKLCRIGSGRRGLQINIGNSGRVLR